MKKGTRYNVNACVRKHTAFKDLQDLLSTDPHYSPAMNTSRKGVIGRELTFLADVYDAARREMGDARRVRRY